MQEYFDYFQTIFFFGLLGVVFVWVAKSYGLFHLPPARDKRTNPVKLSTLLVCFVIYLGITMLIAPVLAKGIETSYAFFSHKDVPTSVFSILQLILLLAIFGLFYLYCNAQGPHVFQWIWKDQSIPHRKSAGTDFLMGILLWIVSFPLVVAIGQLVDMLLTLFFQFEGYEQVAVRYLKTTLESPLPLTLALFTILIAAPIIEEFLFRGLLQSYLKKHMIPKKAIVLSALCFSLFHYAPSQGIGNISLVATLFLFALFLGFIYERQASLFASVGLHMTFNAVSTFRILFFPES